MKKITKAGIEMVQVALILGISGNLLIRVETPGLNISLWILLLVAAIGIVVKRHHSNLWNPQTIPLYLALLFFGAMFSFFDSPQLFLFRMIAIFLILGALVVPALSQRLTESGVIHYISGCLAAGLSAAFGPIVLIADDINWKTLPKSGLTTNLLSILRGLAVAVPVILVIGVLLVAADASFQTFVKDTFSFDAPMFVSHVAVTSIIAWGVLGYLRAAVFGSGPKAEKPAKSIPFSVTPPKFSITEHTTEDPADKNSGKRRAYNEATEIKDEKNHSLIPDYLKLGKIETGILLGSVNLLFAVFLLFQVPYLFGGFDLVQNTPDYKLAQYASRGVEELILLSIFILPLLLASHFMLNRKEKGVERLFRGLAFVQIGLLFVIMISAVNRLNLLTGSLGYGQSIDRFYSYFLLIFLALIFVWFGMTVLRGLRIQFAYGALWSFLFVVGVLHWANPDDYIVRTNVDLMMQGREFDASYNSALSADSVPALLDSLEHLSGDDRTMVRSRLAENHCRWDVNQDFRSWNWSRAGAENRLASIGIDATKLCD